jgi:hypothetical protein
MATIKKDTLHPENEPEVDIYPKTSIDQVENLQANLDALNGDIANANGEIANISTNVENIANKVGDINKDVSTLKYNDTNQDRRIQVLENTSGTTINRVEIAENNITDLQNDVNQNIIDISDIRDDITVLNTAYGSYTDYTEVTNGFLLTYLSGKQIELPIKAGTNVTFSKYPGTNQIVINATGGSVPDNIALLSADNDFTGNNQFVNIRSFGILEFYGGDKQYRFSKTSSGFKFFIISGDNINSLLFPNKTGTIALTTDIPSLADYPTTIFFNNYNAGIGYKDTSTGTIKTVVSTDNNGAQIVLGNSNTGLTLATNARPKVLEDSTVKEVAYVSDIPNTSSFPTLTGNNTWSGKNIFNNGITTGITKYADYITYRQYIFNFPNKNGTLALVEDIPNTSSFPTLAGNNKWTGDNTFDGFSKSIRVNGLFQVSGDEELISATYNQVSYDGFNIAYMDGENQNIFHIGLDFENKARFGFDKYDGSSYNLYIPEKDGTIALLSDIPISLMYSSSRLGENSVDFPFNIDKNYFFTITMTNTGESKSFIYAKGISSTYTIVINSSTSFEVKLDATGSSTRLIFTNKSNADPFVVRAEISK